MLLPHDPIFNLFDEEIKSLSDKKWVLDIGTSKRFAKELTYAQHYFQDNYVALGYRVNTDLDNPCDIDGDIVSLPIRSNSLEGIISLEVIEHVISPQDAAKEMHRVLEKGGKMILTAPFLLPFHGKGNDLSNYSHDEYPDYWRFTHQGLTVLFKDFSQVKVIPFTGTIEHYLYHVLGLYGKKWIDNSLVRGVVRKLHPQKTGQPTYRHLVVAIK